MQVDLITLWIGLWILAGSMVSFVHLMVLSVSPYVRSRRMKTFKRWYLALWITLWPYTIWLTICHYTEIKADLKIRRMKQEE